MNNDNKIYKAERRAKALRCDRCPPHRKENIERTARRSWKFRSKKPRQFREKFMVDGQQIDGRLSDGKQKH